MVVAYLNKGLRISDLRCTLEDDDNADIGSHSAMFLVFEILLRIF